MLKILLLFLVKKRKKIFLFHFVFGEKLNYKKREKKKKNPKNRKKVKTKKEKDKKNMKSNRKITNEREKGNKEFIDARIFNENHKK